MDHRQIKGIQENISICLTDYDKVWLTRLGMNGPEFKTNRKVLMENLTGHSAFRTPAEEAKWKARQAEKREALKAAKAAEATEEVETA